MIDQVLGYLRDHLNTVAFSDAEPGAGGSVEETVIFPEGDKLRDSVEFKLGAVTLLLLDLQEETTLRSPDRFEQVAPNGERQRISPEIRLNLHVLFVSHFKAYSDSLRTLSRVIRHFQRFRHFNHGKAPDLPEDVDQLMIELVTLTFAEQNEIWNALRTSQRPSALYRVRMVVFRDRSTAPTIPVDQIQVRVPA